MEQLAILGGKPFINHSFNPHNYIGNEERVAVDEVLKSGVLSKYLGAWSEDFYGGPKVQEFEYKWADYFEVKYAVAMNSNTSGLIAALGAIGLEPGDEVIVSPWSMAASATSVLVWNAIPIFADIEAETFNLDLHSVEQRVNEKTKAIVVPDIFGHAADFSGLTKLAKKYHLKIIEDAAQAPGAFYYGKRAGTLGDIGVYSLNYHKHIHAGEGGVCVTNDPDLAERMQLIRNHAEAVVAEKNVVNLSNMVGFNFRMTEIAAAISLEQLKKLNKIVQKKQSQAQQLVKALSSLDGVKLPVVRPRCTHVYYIFPMTLNLDKLGAQRDTLVRALQAEGVPGLSSGYVNIHRLPMYQQKMAYGKQNYPWSADFARKDIDYSVGICPVAESLHDHNLIKMVLCLYDFSAEDIDKIAGAFQKVWGQLDLLKHN